jgi:hypothetical protein
MIDVIQDCMNNFGRPPRKISFVDKHSYLRVSKPDWLRLNPTDDLALLFENYNTLLSRGLIVWGHLVQANTEIFENGKSNLPGEVVYSLMIPRFDDTAILPDIARELFQLKETKPENQQLHAIATHLATEYSRVFGLKVPPSISPRRACLISTTLFVRKHLPGQKLNTSLFPLIVNPKSPHVVLPLPERYWPKEFVEWWNQ